MAVTVTSPVEGLTPGEVYEGPNEAWLLENGYAAAVDPGDVPDLDHPSVEVDEYPGEDLDEREPLTPSHQSYGPEVALETTIQSTVADERLAQLRSTKPEYSSDPAPVEPEPEEEPDPEA